jgi:hypothetical protein
VTTLEGIEPVRDLAKALGLLGADDQLDATWFSDPGRIWAECFVATCSATRSSVRSAR